MHGYQRKFKTDDDSGPESGYATRDNARGGLSSQESTESSQPRPLKRQSAISHMEAIASLSSQEAAESFESDAITFEARGAAYSPNSQLYSHNQPNRAYTPSGEHRMTASDYGQGGSSHDGRGSSPGRRHRDHHMSEAYSSQPQSRQYRPNVDKHGTYGNPDSFEGYASPGQYSEQQRQYQRSTSASDAPRQDSLRKLPPDARRKAYVSERSSSDSDFSARMQQRPSAGNIRHLNPSQHRGPPRDLPPRGQGQQGYTLGPGASNPGLMRVETAPGRIVRRLPSPGRHNPPPRRGGPPISQPRMRVQDSVDDVELIEQSEVDSRYQQQRVANDHQQMYRVSNTHIRGNNSPKGQYPANAQASVPNPAVSRPPAASTVTTSHHGVPRVSTQVSTAPAQTAHRPVHNPSQPNTGTKTNMSNTTAAVTAPAASNAKQVTPSLRIQSISSSEVTKSSTAEPPASGFGLFSKSLTSGISSSPAGDISSRGVSFMMKGFKSIRSMVTGEPVPPPEPPKTTAQSTSVSGATTSTSQTVQSSKSSSLLGSITSNVSMSPSTMGVVLGNISSSGSSLLGSAVSNIANSIPNQGQSVPNTPPNSSSKFNALPKKMHTVPKDVTIPQQPSRQEDSTSPTPMPLEALGGATAFPYDSAATNQQSASQFTNHPHRSSASSGKTVTFKTDSLVKGTATASTAASSANASTIKPAAASQVGKPEDAAVKSEPNIAKRKSKWSVVQKGIKKLLNRNTEIKSPICRRCGLHHSPHEHPKPKLDLMNMPGVFIQRSNSKWQTAKANISKVQAAVQSMQGGHAALEPSEKEMSRLQHNQSEYADYDKRSRSQRDLPSSSRWRGDRRRSESLEAERHPYDDEMVASGYSDSYTMGVNRQSRGEPSVDTRGRYEDTRGPRQHHSPRTSRQQSQSPMRRRPPSQESITTQDSWFDTRTYRESLSEEHAYQTPPSPRRRRRPSQGSEVSSPGTPYGGTPDLSYSVGPGSSPSSAYGGTPPGSPRSRRVPASPERLDPASRQLPAYPAAPEDRRKKKLSLQHKSFSLDAPNHPHLLYPIDESTKQRSSSYSNTYSRGRSHSPLGAHSYMHIPMSGSSTPSPSSSRTGSRQSLSSSLRRKKFGASSFFTDAGITIIVPRSRRSVSLDIEDRQLDQQIDWDRLRGRPSPHGSDSSQVQDSDVAQSFIVTSAVTSQGHDQLAVEEGTFVIPLEEPSGGWWKVQTIDGLTGYIPEASITHVPYGSRPMQVTQTLQLPENVGIEKLRRGQIVFAVGPAEQGVMPVMTEGITALCPVKFLARFP